MNCIWYLMNTKLLPRYSIMMNVVLKCSYIMLVIFRAICTFYPYSIFICWWLLMCFVAIFKFLLNHDHQQIKSLTNLWIIKKIFQQKIKVEFWYKFRLVHFRNTSLKFVNEWRHMVPFILFFPFRFHTEGH